jgi:hypothetical protein
MTHSEQNKVRLAFERYEELVSLFVRMTAAQREGEHTRAHRMRSDANVLYERIQGERKEINSILNSNEQTTLF